MARTGLKHSYNRERRCNLVSCQDEGTNQLAIPETQQPNQNQNLSH